MEEGNRRKKSRRAARPLSAQWALRNVDGPCPCQLVAVHEAVRAEGRFSHKQRIRPGIDSREEAGHLDCRIRARYGKCLRYHGGYRDTVSRRCDRPRYILETVR